MRIKSIKISNVRVFPFVENFDEYNGISFEYNNKDILILIGPNGSGKSTVIEILQTLFSKTIPRYFEKKDERLDREQYDDYLQENSLNGGGVLLSNRLTRDKEQKIEITIHLDSNDTDNIEFLVDKNDLIIEYIKKYSKICDKNDNYDQDFSTRYVNPIKEFTKDGEMKFPQDVKMTFISEEGKGDFKLGETEFPLFYGYLRYFDLIENIIDIHNNEDEEHKWSILERSFNLISSHRNYNDVDMKMDLEPDQNTDLSKNYKKQVAQNTTLSARNTQPAIFRKVLFDIFNEYVRLLKKHTEEEANKKIENFEVFKRIKEKTNDFLTFNIKIKPVRKDSIAKFKLEFSEGKEVININELSAGEKAIIHLIFVLYGNKANNGCLLIDEPEQHLHPQWQTKFREILEEEICEDKTDYQIIIATHSPSFLSIGTINNALRLHLSKAGAVGIKKPKIEEEERFLLKTLTYTNSSKIFFVNKAILVEGISDEYFWSYYLDKLSKDNKDIKDYEIYDIGGKGSFLDWQKFLSKWGIRTHYIADLDNIKEILPSSEEKIKKLCEMYYNKDSLYKKIIDSLKKPSSKDGKALLKSLDDFMQNNCIMSEESKRSLTELWAWIRERHQPVNKEILNSDESIKEEIIKSIEKLYDKEIYILKEGTIEEYTGTSINNKVESMINFCNGNKELVSGKEELDNIVNKIFNM
jgi:predicted ATP-dependent endonuclease of OLD family